MKQISKLLMVAICAMQLFTACDKADDLPYYNNGSPVTLTSSVKAVAAVAADSNKTVLTFTWTSPNYANVESGNKFIIQIDTAGGNFSKSFSREVTGLTSVNLSNSFTAKELNNILLGYGFLFGKEYNMVARVVSSYSNSNERLVSNAVAIKMTPYKTPPKVALPTTGKLFIIGGATTNAAGSGDGWGTPIIQPELQLAQIDETTYGGIFFLYGGEQFLILPQATNFDNKFAVNSNSAAGINAGGTFGQNAGSAFNENFLAPVADGWYKIILDFQTGLFTIKAMDPAFTGNLYITGNATPSDWTNQPPATQKFTPENSSVFNLSLPLIGGKSYTFLTEYSNWDKKFSIANKNDPALVNGGDFQVGGNDILAPATDGTYKIQVNFLTMKFTVKQ